MLSDNYTNASRRLATVIKKLKTQPEILDQYDQVIKEQLESGVVEEVRQDQVLEPGNVHYLPHRGMRGHRGFLLEVQSHAGMFSPLVANPT